MELAEGLPETAEFCNRRCMRLLTVTVLLAAGACTPTSTVIDTPASVAVVMDTVAPAGWALSGMTPTAFQVGIDRSVKHSGMASAFVRPRSATVNPEAWSTIMQSIRADEFVGKRVRLSAYVKTAGARAQMWLRIDGPGEALGMDNMDKRPITGTTDWQLVEIVMDVPATSIGLAYGLIVSEGTAWIDDVKLEAVNNIGVTGYVDPAARGSDQEAATDRQRYAKRGTRPVNPDFEAN